MKQTLFVITITLLAATKLLAQQNPRPGFVITQTGDTLWGQVDLRTNTTNQRQCSFRQDGKPAFKTYLPGEIEGYRLTENGKFYVTRSLDIEGEKKTLFVEYLVKGMLNLLLVEQDGKKYYYLENEQGETALYAEDGKLPQVASELRAKTNQLSSVILQSPSAMKDLRYGGMNQSRMVALAHDYHRDMCTEGDMECMEFEYDHRKDRCGKEIRLIGGYRTDISDNGYYRQANWLVAGVALDLLMKKRARGMLIQLELDGMPLLGDKHAGGLQLMLGPAYRWGNESQAVRPILHGGLNIVRQIDNREPVIREKNIGEVWSEALGFGPYFGVGLDVPVGNQGIVVYANMHMFWGRNKQCDYPRFICPQITASWRLGKIKKKKQG